MKVHYKNLLLYHYWINSTSKKYFCTFYVSLINQSTKLMNTLHHRFSFDPVSSPSTELAGFRMVMDFTTSRHLSRLHTSSFTSTFLFISFSACFFFTFVSFVSSSVTQQFEAFNVIFSSVLKTWPYLYHRNLLAFAILSKDLVDLIWPSTRCFFYPLSLRHTSL